MWNWLGEGQWRALQMLESASALLANIPDRLNRLHKMSIAPLHR
jgi:hypothetical protein